MKEKLIDNTYVAKSKIHGYGVFASKKLLKGDIIVQSIISPIVPEGSISKYGWGVDEGKEVHPFGSPQLMNSSEDNNAETSPDFYENLEKRIVTIIALRDIKKDEEITLNYTENLPIDFQYKVIKNFISKELADFIGLYFLNYQNFNQGNLEDHQSIQTPSYYAHTVTETLLASILKKLEDITKVKLHPTYSYLRVYKKGDELKFHKDREACEVSVTINLKQSESWPIYMDGKKLILHPGDACIYKGMEVEHGRYKFEGDYCVQVFCHYVHTYIDHANDNVNNPTNPKFITNLGE